MKSKLSLLVAGLALALITVVQAAGADVTGKWTAQVPGRNGQTREQTFTFKADGEKLTGSVSGMQGNQMDISDGKVSGSDISFNVTGQTTAADLVNAPAGNYADTVILTVNP